MKRAFLFGAEAEVDFNVSCGPEFARKILLSKESEMQEINKAIKNYYKEKKEKDIDFESMMICAINIGALHNKRP